MPDAATIQVDAPPAPEPLSQRVRDASVSVTVPASPSPLARVRSAASVAPVGSGSTAYFYELEDGSRGRASDPADIPDGATVVGSRQL